MVSDRSYYIISETLSMNEVLKNKLCKEHEMDVSPHSGQSCRVVELH